MKTVCNRYLKILNVSRKNPSLEYLTELLTSHIINIPFENISKIHYYLTKDLKYIPDFDLYLTGIEKYNFGGTCYSNNYYFNQLLNHLGFNVWLCGADMKEPDVHLVNVVIFNEKMYLADVGYGAPFFNPMPLDLDIDYRFSFGNEHYVLLTRNSKDQSELKQYREEKIKHGYFVKLYNRNIGEFEKVIKDSFLDSATFLNRITIVKFGFTSSTSVRNYSLVEMQNNHLRKTQINNKAQIIEQIVNHYSIPRQIVLESVLSIKNL